MSEFIGTPGPWQVRKWSGDEWPDRRISVGPESDGIATAVCISPRYCSGTQAEADAHLISAAPELLKACQAFLAYHDYEDYKAAADMARAAIAKATREPQLLATPSPAYHEQGDK